MTTAEKIISQTTDKEVDKSINAEIINKHLGGCLTWHDKLAVDFYATFQVIKKEYERYF
jgi:hypothetical protein